MGALSTNNTSTTHAKIGDKVELAFTTNEAIDLTTSTAIIHGKAATMTSTGANAYKATITLDGTETQGAATYALTVKDVAGNAAATVSTGATGSVTVDFTHPVFYPSVTGQSAAFSDNTINIAEAAADQTVRVNLIGMNVIAGDKVIVDSSWSTIEFTIPLSETDIINKYVDVTIPANTFTGTGGIIAARVADKAGNFSAKSLLYEVKVDLVAPKALSVVLNDVNGNGVGDAGETLVIAFDKAMDSAKADGLVEDFNDNEGLADNVFGIHSGTGQLGSHFVTDATLAWNPAKTELTITLGAGATGLVSGTALVLKPSKFTDVAGNPAESNGQKVTLNKIK